MFFTSKENMKTLRGFLRKAKAAHVNDETRKKRLDRCQSIIGYIRKSPEDWDARCAFNIKQSGDQFLQQLRTFDQAERMDIDNLHSMSNKFLCEFKFFSG